MTKEQLEIELAEAVAALQRIQILVLRNCLTVNNTEVFDTVRHLTSHWQLPEVVREHVIRIRKERWNIQ